MKGDLYHAQELLRKQGRTLAVCRGEQVAVSTEKGIAPLLELTDKREDWVGASAADKIVGKAAAMLYAWIGVRAVYAEVLSETAKKVLEENHIAVSFETVTKAIINRKGTGPCPMEVAVQALCDPSEAPRVLRAALSQLGKN